jgi:hypothetical protein
LVGDEIKTARTGDYVMVPRNTRHAFRVESETVRFLNGYTPASLEAYVVERMPTTERVVPPKGVSPTMEFLATNPHSTQKKKRYALPQPRYILISSMVKSLLSWVAGIAAAVIGGVLIWLRSYWLDAGRRKGTSTVVVTATGCPAVITGRYFHCLTASMAAATSCGGPLTKWAS